MDNITVIIINFQTPDLLAVAVESFFSQYNDIKMLLIDNGSKDSSNNTIAELSSKYGKCLMTLLLNENIFHGPAMHLGIQYVNSDFVFFLDSDTKTIKGGFLEEMTAKLESSNKIYAVGKTDRVNKRGFISSGGNIIAVRTPYMLINRDLYLKFRPFEHHGLPTLKNFQDANKAGFHFVDFPIQNYIEHFGRGTADRFGYQLGIQSKIDYILNKLGL